MTFLGQDVEATVNLRYITSGHLKTSRRDFNPESGQIRQSLQVTDKRWQPKMGFDKWNSTTSTFTEVSRFSINNLKFDRGVLYRPHL